MKDAEDMAQAIQALFKWGTHTDCKVTYIDHRAAPRSHWQLAKKVRSNPITVAVSVVWEDELSVAAVQAAIDEIVAAESTALKGAELEEAMAIRTIKGRIGPMVVATVPDIAALFKGVPPDSSIVIESHDGAQISFTRESEWPEFVARITNPMWKPEPTREPPKTVIPGPGPGFCPIPTIEGLDRSCTHGGWQEREDETSGSKTYTCGHCLGTITFDVWD